MSRPDPFALGILPPGAFPPPWPAVIKQVARWNAALSRVDLRHFAIPVTWTFLASADGRQLELRFAWALRDRDTGTPRTVYSLRTYTLDEAAKWDPVEALRHEIGVFLRHEIDECLRVDGVLAFDPHRHERTTP